MTCAGFRRRENVLRGGRYRPVPLARVAAADQQRHFVPGPSEGHGAPQPRPKPAGGNPTVEDTMWHCSGQKPGQGSRTHYLGQLQQGTQERETERNLERGAAELESSAAERNELETWPTSKHGSIISLFVRLVKHNISPFVCLEDLGTGGRAARVLEFVWLWTALYARLVCDAGGPLCNGSSEEF